MKQLLLLLIISIIYLNSIGQLTKNNWLFGGSGSFYSYNETYASPAYNTTAKYTNIDVSASVGYFIVDKLVGGLRPTFSSFKGEVTSLGGGNTNSYKLAIGPFVRYYFLKKDKPFNLLTDINYQYGINNFLGSLHEKGKFNTFSIMGGTEIFFNTTAGLEILLGYTQRIVSIENSPGAFNDNKKGFQASIGFQIHLEKL